MPLYHKDEAYIFSETGQHLETRSLLSDAPKSKFRYNEDSGILEEITNHKQSTVENAILFMSIQPHTVVPPNSRLIGSS